MTDHPHLLTVDCDVHCAVPSVDVLTPYLPEHWKQFHAAFGLRASPAVNLTYPDWCTMLATTAGGDAFEQLQANLDARQVDHAILNCYYGVESFTHPFLGPALARAVNDWVAEHWLARDPRLLASASVTPEHPEAAVEEINRIAENPRFVQIIVPARSVHGYGDRRYWPLWRAVDAEGLAVAVSVGGGTGTAPTPTGWPNSFFEDHVSAVVNFQSQVASFVASGIFEELPGLRIVLLESGWTWLPAFMWRREMEARAFHREVPWLKHPIPDYVRRHFRLTTQPTDAPPEALHLRQLVGHLGSDEMLLYGSDYPHRYRTGIEELATALTTQQLQRVMGCNASELYMLKSRRPESARVKG
jgi:predicted TIM-barrel fold metal-dependent hydrolase